MTVKINSKSKQSRQIDTNMKNNMLIYGSDRVISGRVIGHVLYCRLTVDSDVNQSHQELKRHDTDICNLAAV